MALCEYNCNAALCRTNMACVTQIPPSEVLIQPAPFAVTVPGPILSASCEPVAVAQNAPGATGYGGYPYWGYGYGCGYGGRYRYGSCSSPCYSPGYFRRGSFSSCGPC